MGRRTHICDGDTVASKPKASEDVQPQFSSNLANLDIEQKLFDSYADNQELNVEIRWNDHTNPGLNQTQLCRYRLDKVAPDVSLTVNSKTDYERVAWHGTGNIAVVSNEQAIVFTSNAKDVDRVEFCAQKLNDEFFDDDGIEAQAWEHQQKADTCGEYATVKTGQQVIPGDGRGFWSLIYHTVDGVGHKSTPKRAVVLFKQTDKLAFFRNAAKRKTELQSSRNIVAISVDDALKLESDRLRLPTLYEQNLAKKYVRSVALSTLAQRDLQFPLEPFKDDIDECVFGNPTENFYCINHREIVEWNSRDGRIVKRHALPPEYYGSVLPTKEDGKLILVSSTFIILYDITSSSVISRWAFESADERNRLTAAVFDKTTNTIVVCAGPDEVRTLKYPELTMLQTYKLPLSTRNKHEDRAIALVPNSTAVLLNDEQNNYTLLDYQSGSVELFAERTGTGIATVFAISDDGKKMVAGLNDSTVELWDMVTRKKKVDLSRLNSPVIAMSVADDSRTLVVGAYDGSLEVFDLVSQRRVQTLPNAALYGIRSASIRDPSRLLISSDRKPLLYMLRAPLVSFETSLTATRHPNGFFVGAGHVILGVPYENTYINSAERSLRTVQDKSWFHSFVPNLVNLVNDAEVWNLGLCRFITWEMCARNDAKSGTVLLEINENLNVLVRNRDRNLEFVDTRTSTVISTWELEKGLSNYEYRLTASGEYLLVLSINELCSIEVSSGKKIWCSILPRPNPVMVTNRDALNVLLVFDDGSIRQLDPVTGLLKIVEGISFPAAEMSPLLTATKDGSMLAVSTDARFEIWDQENKEKLLNLTSAVGPNFKMGQGRISSDGLYAAWLGTPHFWSGEPLQPIKVMMFDLDFDRAIGTLCGLSVDKGDYLACGGGAR